MSNEELVTAIQGGDRAQLGELWEQVRRLVVKPLLPYSPDYAVRGNVIDLDEPIPGDVDGDSSRADLIPDRAAQVAFEAVEYHEWSRQLRATLEVCIDTLPPEQACTIRARYFGRLTPAATGQVFGHNAEWVRTQEVRGLRSLRKPRSTRRLWEFREDIISSHAYHTGLGSFVSNQASATELTVERLTDYVDRD